MRERVLIIDLDNCLFLDEKTRKGSEEVKDEVWFKIFPECDRRVLEPILEQIKREIAGGKGDRRDIVLKLCEIFSPPNFDEEVNHRCNLFGKMVKKGILKIGVSKNNRKALKLISREIPIYVNTATPKSQAREILGDLKLLGFLKDIYGRPETKLENMKLIIEREKVDPKECLFIDDQEIGYLIARDVGCNFVGMQTYRNIKWHNGNNLTFPIIYSLLEIVK